MLGQALRALGSVAMVAGLLALAPATPEDPPTPIDPVAPSNPGGPIPPPGPDGCLCNCPGTPTSKPEFWFCGLRCLAVLEDPVVTVGELEDYLDEHCFPMRAGEDGSDCVECLGEHIEYYKKLCRCEAGTLGCDLNEPPDDVVDCEDVKILLGHPDPECVTREMQKALLCCFLGRIQTPEAMGGCETVFAGEDPCNDELKACLEELGVDPDGAEGPEKAFFSPPLDEHEIDSLLVCYGCDCCKDLDGEGSGTAAIRDCGGDGPSCDYNGDNKLDCSDLNAFLDESAACMSVAPSSLEGEELTDLVCAYLQKCGDCALAKEFIDCLEERLCRLLTEAEMAALQACMGEECDLGGCCKSINAEGAWGGSSSTTASYAACNETIRCDQNCIDGVTCDDFSLFVAESQARCNGGAPYDRAQILLLACAFMQQCSNEELCSCMLETLDDHFTGLETPDDPLTEEEIENLSACMPCGEICKAEDSNAEPGEMCADSPGGAKPDSGTCPPCPDEKGQNAPARTAQGASVPSGAAHASATDIQVQVPGPDMRVARSNSSDPAYDSGCAAGEGWAVSIFQHVTHDSGANTLIVHLGADKQVTVDVSSGAKITDSATGLDFWRVPGASTQIVHKSLATYAGTTYAVWRLREQGGAATDFYRQPESGETSATAVYPALVGLIAGVTDAYTGNRHDYSYGLWMGSGGDGVARLKRIKANPPSSGAPAATIEFSYNMGSSVNAGRLKQVTVKRPDALGNEIEVERVMYRYIGDADITALGISDDCGTDGDLVLVIHQERVDVTPSADWPTWRERVTHYRYHGNSTALTGAQGSAHQLKMIVSPEQIEFAVTPWVETLTTKTVKTCEQYAMHLLTLDDTANGWGTGSPTVVSLASQVNLAYETSGAKRITKIQLASGCGCGGGSPTHRQYSYTYVASTASRSTVMVDESPGPTATGFRRYWYETYAPSGSGPQYMRSRAVEELDSSKNSTHRAWIEWFDHDSTSHMLVQERTPATFPNGIGTTSSYDYQPGTSATAPVYAISASGGLSRRYAYVGSGNLYGYKKLASTEVGQGASPSTWILTETIEYGDLDGAGLGWTSANSRGWLPSRVSRFRTTGGTGSAATDIETSVYRYGFLTSGTNSWDIAWHETEVEAESVAENGPGRTYTRYELFDAQGQNTWSVAEDDAVTKRSFGSPSGLYAVPSGMANEVTLNAPTTGLANPYHGLATSGFGRSGSGGSLTTTLRRDLLGRVTESIAPGGVSTYTLHCMFGYPTRKWTPTYVELTLPHQWDDGTALQTNGAATATWLTASGRELGSSEYLVATAPYKLDNGGSSTSSGWGRRVAEYSLNVEAGRRLTTYSYNGVVASQAYWAQLVASAGDAPFGGAFESRFDYDDVGRIEMKSSSNGTVAGFKYDILDRVVEVSTDVLGSGAAWPSTFTATAQFAYDGGTTSTPAIGNGNLTEQTALIASGSHRVTSHSYDFRDRRTITQNPDAPHELVVYDNLDRVTQRGLFSSVPTSMTHTNRGLYTETAYSQRGLAYRERTATVPGASSPVFLETNRWFDEAGRTVGVWAPTAPGVKTTYDGLGRVIATYIGDRGGDAAPGATGNYAHVFNAHASVLTSDVVFEERSQSYATSGVPTLATTWRRAHDASATGALSAYSGGNAAYALATYAAVFHDGALRPIRQADYGTNLSDDWMRTGGSAPSLSTVPDWDSSGNQLVSQTRYDGKGRVDSATDPTGKVTKYAYDMADRRIATFENWDSANPPALSWTGDSCSSWWGVSALDGSKPDVNRATTFVYNGAGATTRLTAYNYSDGSTLALQHTDYQYGVTKGTGAGDSALNSNDLLHSAVYPSDVSCLGGGTATFYAAYAYNLQGEATYMEEGKGTAAGSANFSSKHSYARDDMGRVTVDKATAFGTGINARVNALTYSYDSFGRLGTALSHSSYTSSGSPGTTTDMVEFAYTDLWQVAQIDQNPTRENTYTSGVPNGFTTRTTYAYDTLAISGATQNYSRLSSLTYPDGSVEDLKYGSSTSTPDSRISRATSISLDSTAIVTYDRVGIDTFAMVDYRDPGVVLNRFRSEAGSTTTGYYPGLDRFGRVRRQMWADSTFAAGSGGNPNKPPVVSTKYSYTKASDRIGAIDDRPGAQQPLSNEYEYDGLHRLTEARLGAWSGSAVPVGAGSQRWRQDDGTVTIDALGNWRQSWFDLDGSGTFSDTTERDDRQHDLLNRITERSLKGQGSGGSDLNIGSLDYDLASNLSLWKRQSGTSAVNVEASHDAWNRLVDVRVGGDLRAREAHNALHWRTYRFGDVRTTLGSTPALDPDTVIDQARFMHYGQDWRLLEERVDDDFDFDAWKGGTYAASAIDRTQQYVWGLRYIDDIVLHRIDANKDGDYADTGDSTWYHLTDAQSSTVCILKPDASVAERVSYSAYGVARHRWPGDVTGDGAVVVTGGGSNDDLAAVTAASGASISGGSPTYRAELDFDRDGDVDTADQALVGSAIAALPAGQLSPITATSGGGDNPVGWDGYLYSPETALYEVRFRVYDPGLGRWIERDLIGYVDGASLFEYGRSDPGSGADPRGLDRHVFAFEGLSGHPTEDPIRFSNNWVEDDWKPVIDKIPESKWHYYTEADRGVRRAVEEATAIAKTPVPSAPEGLCYHTIAVLGYSNGGRAAIQFAEALRDKGIAVNLGFTADPIPKGLELAPPFILFPGLFLKKPANVEWWENYYQRTDWILKGNSVANADHEETFDLGVHGHIKITGDQRVKDHLYDAVRCMPPWRADWRWWRP